MKHKYIAHAFNMSTYIMPVKYTDAQFLKSSLVWALIISVAKQVPARAKL